MIVTICSVAGSPGSTSLAVGLAASSSGSQPNFLFEADPDGGRLGALLGVNVEPGLVELAVAARGGLLNREDFERCSAPVGDFALIPGPPSAEQSASALTSCRSFAAGMGFATWFIDAGRLSARSPALPLAVSSDRTLVVSRGDLAHLQLLPHRVDALSRAGCAVGVCVVEPTHWPPHEIAAFAGADVVGVLPRIAGHHDLSSLRYRAWRPWWAAVQRMAAALTPSAEVAV